MTLYTYVSANYPLQLWHLGRLSIVLHKNNISVTDLDKDDPLNEKTWTIPGATIPGLEERMAFGLFLASKDDELLYIVQVDSNGMGVEINLNTKTISEWKNVGITKCLWRPEHTTFYRAGVEGSAIE